MSTNIYEAQGVTLTRFAGGPATGTPPGTAYQLTVQDAYAMLTWEQLLGLRAALEAESVHRQLDHFARLRSDLTPGWRKTQLGNFQGVLRGDKQALVWASSQPRLNRREAVLDARAELARRLEEVTA